MFKYRLKTLLKHNAYEYHFQTSRIHGSLHPWPSPREGGRAPAPQRRRGWGEARDGRRRVRSGKILETTVLIIHKENLQVTMWCPVAGSVGVSMQRALFATSHLIKSSMFLITSLRRHAYGDFFEWSIECFSEPKVGWQDGL